MAWEIICFYPSVFGEKFGAKRFHSAKKVKGACIYAENNINDGRERLNLA